MKKLLMILFFIFINLNIVYADTIKDSDEKIIYKEISSESIQKCFVKVSQGSSYIVSIPKQTDKDFVIDIKGDLAGDEFLNISVDNSNINKNIYYNELPCRIYGNKIKNSSIINYHLKLKTLS